MYHRYCVTRLVWYLLAVSFVIAIVPFSTSCIARQYAVFYRLIYDYYDPFYDYVILIIIKTTVFFVITHVIFDIYYPMTDADTTHLSTLPIECLPKNRGLRNLGNTCYVNTTLQCLLHCLPLTFFFLRRTFEDHLGPNATKEEAVNNNCIGSEIRPLITSGTPSRMCMKMYFLFLQDMCNAKKVSTPYNPKDLFLLFSKASWCRNQKGETTSVFSIGQQHDMVEFLQFVFDIIHDTSFCQVKVNISGKIEGRMDQMLVESYKQFGKHCEKQYSFISDMMTGQYFIQNQTCDNVSPTEHSETYDPFTILTLPIPVGVKHCSVYDCFDTLIQPEVIDGWKGELTDKERMIERKTYLWRLPQILIVHLKRFVNRYVKNECTVQLEQQLNLSNYCLSNDNEKAKYTLFAIGNHEGNYNFGHYFADCKNSQHQWHRFNDSHVSSINPKELCGQKAYVLFYYRQM